MHDGTYKVFVDFQRVADITQIPPPVFRHMKRLKASRASSKKLPVVPVEFLKMSLHLELSHPMGYIERWQKLYPRMKKLYHHYPAKKCNKTLAATSQQDPQRSIEKMLKTNHIVLAGFAAARAYLPGVVVPFYEVIAKDPTTIINKAHTLVAGSTVEHIDQSDGFLMPPATVLKKANKVLLVAYPTSGCHAITKTDDGFTVLSIDSLLMYEYAMVLTPNPIVPTKDTRCLIGKLVDAESKADTTSGIFSRFTLECFGEQEGMRTIKEKRWLQKKAPSVYRRGG